MTGSRGGSPKDRSSSYITILRSASIHMEDMTRESVWLEDRYYITWCNGYKGYPTIGLGYTYDFKKFYQLENAFCPLTETAFCFPER